MYEYVYIELSVSGYSVTKDFFYKETFDLHWR